MLQKLRLNNDMTQADVANELHVDRSLVAKWEARKALPSISMLLPLAHLYRVSVERLLEILLEAQA